MINLILPNQDGNQNEYHQKKYEKAGTRGLHQMLLPEDINLELINNMSTCLLIKNLYICLSCD